ncbi:MAG: hypothetical protein WBB82_17410 [Limnothrix sp.]
MNKLEGELEAYWDQSWEGRIAFAFNTFSNTRPFFLENGHYLTIYESEATILWAGTIAFVPRGFFDRHQLKVGIWSGTKQKGVSYADWMDWFWRRPPLKATLIIP